MLQITFAHFLLSNEWRRRGERTRRGGRGAWEEQKGTQKEQKDRARATKAS